MVSKAVRVFRRTKSLPIYDEGLLSWLRTHETSRLFTTCTTRLGLDLYTNCSRQAGRGDSVCRKNRTTMPASFEASGTWGSTTVALSRCRRASVWQEYLNAMRFTLLATCFGYLANWERNLQFCRKFREKFFVCFSVQSEPASPLLLHMVSLGWYQDAHQVGYPW